MKKMWYVIILMFIVGCGETEPTKPVQDTVDTIQESDQALAVTYVKELLSAAEMSLLTNMDQTCLQAKELGSKGATAGEICVEESGNVVAQNVEYRGYVCNGNKTNMNCVVKTDD